MGKKHRGNNWDDDDGSRKNRSCEVSQEELNEYIHVSRPGVIVLIIALLMMLIALLVWGFAGTLPVTETVTGLVIDVSEEARMKSSEADATDAGVDSSEADATDTVMDSSEADATDAGMDSSEGTDADDEEILIVCFLDASRFNGEAVKNFRDEAYLKMPDQRTFEGEIEMRYMYPMSKEEARNVLYHNEWVVEKCAPQDYNWLVTIRPKENLTDYAFTLAEVTFVTEEVPPITFLMK